MDVRWMIKRLGPPTLFITCSTAEWFSESFIAYLRQINSCISGIDSMTPAELCGMDPVNVSIHLKKNGTSSSISWYVTRISQFLAMCVTISGESSTKPGVLLMSTAFCGSKMRLGEEVEDRKHNESKRSLSEYLLSTPTTQQHRFGQDRQMSGVNYNVSVTQIMESEKTLKIVSMVKSHCR